MDQVRTWMVKNTVMESELESTSDLNGAKRGRGVRTWIKFGLEWCKTRSWSPNMDQVRTWMVQNAVVESEHGSSSDLNGAKRGHGVRTWINFGLEWWKTWSWSPNMDQLRTWMVKNTVMESELESTSELIWQKVALESKPASQLITKPSLQHNGALTEIWSNSL